ncbi:LpqB family beta-propeller domain-containing protein [Micromonospora sp. DR5-3]|uniref:LpqB family beta-propeller domain-containing protein n=1 Tax=unclassified Micromonospora TaxID=2617518 RepID=UPI0011D4919E|nr:MULTISPECIES: LpqB family beta-propeller domain-containing protein [unclassified Micromonospora]MCW3814708.1 LpqB family beta-propeller domain-containing protein [Micromonospora sp. DR5-3]TYC23497.1 hypothetical protein FXF52_15040 [Micromonospora sp. MP36]
MRHRLLTALLAGVLLPAGLAGCGIPHETQVQVDGAGPAGQSGALSGSSDQPPAPTASNDPKEFIRNYLSAAAGERDQAVNRVKQFIAPEGQSRLRDRQSSEIELFVVRLPEEPEATPPNNEGTSEVRVKVQQLGVLRADGSLAPPVASDTEYKFKLRRVGDSGWRITDPPKVLLLSDEALYDYYAPHTIYFWNSDQSRLVPDQRYLPQALPAERKVTEVIRWLAAGPPDWLSPGVIRLPDNTSLINNATGSDGRWEVNLNMPGAKDAQLAHLATQLAWSLPEQVTGQLDLKIQNQSRLVVDIGQEKSGRPPYPLDGNPERFCVYDGAIHPLSFPGEPRGTVPVDAASNRSIVTAALTRSGGRILAALVVTRSGRQQLLVGAGPSPVTVFKGGREFTSVSRPTWLRSTDPQHPYGLTAVDGVLYRFDEVGNLTRVPLGVDGKVTAVAASVEGHRVALVVNGALYVAAVSTDGGAPSLGQPRRLFTKLTNITAVDWYAESRLVFAGSEPRGGTRDPRPAIYGSSVDGALEKPLEQDIGAQVTRLSAYPGPSGALPAYSYMYEANNGAYTPSGIIKPEQVLNLASPTPGNKAPNPTAPFFLY